MKKKLSVTKVDELYQEILRKIMRGVNRPTQTVYSLSETYKTHIMDEYVTIVGIKRDGELITRPQLLNKPNIRTLPIYDLAEIEDIINPI